MPATPNPTRDLRTEILRTARCLPTANTATIARRLSCHPDTVRRHLRVPPLHPPNPTTTFAAAYTTTTTARAARAAALRCPPAHLAVYAAEPSHTVAEAAHANPNCPPRSFFGFHRRPAAITAAIAARSDAPARVVEHCARSRFASVRAATAANPNCRAGTLAALARDDTPNVRAAAARNPNCDPASLHWIARHTLGDARLNTARHPNCGPGTLHWLGTYNNAAKLRTAVAANPNCRPATLTHLADDRDHTVREAAHHHPLRHLPGSRVAVTGTIAGLTRLETFERLRTIGATPQTRVGATTDILIAAEQDHTSPPSGKTRDMLRAERRGIPIIEAAAIAGGLHPPPTHTGDEQ